MFLKLRVFQECLFAFIRICKKGYIYLSLLRLLLQVLNHCVQGFFIKLFLIAFSKTTINWLAPTAKACYMCVQKTKIFCFANQKILGDLLLQCSFDMHDVRKAEDVSLFGTPVMIVSPLPCDPGAL